MDTAPQRDLKLSAEPLKSLAPALRDSCEGVHALLSGVLGDCRPSDAIVSWIYVHMHEAAHDELVAFMLGLIWMVLNTSNGRGPRLISRQHEDCWTAAEQISMADAIAGRRDPKRTP